MDAASWDERYAANEYIWDTSPNVFVEELVSPLDPGTVLDVAGGEGRNAVWLAEQGWAATIVDFSVQGLQKAERLAGEHGVTVNTICGDLETWNADTTFDLVLLSYIHAPEPTIGDMLKRAATWVTPGGHMVLIGHERTNVEFGHGGPPDPSVNYDFAATLRHLSGLTLLRAEIRNRHVDTESGPAITFDNVLLAYRPT